MSDESGDEILSRFVLRARRIAAHSLVQDRRALAAHARGQMSGTLDSSGRITLTQLLPEDEEGLTALFARYARTRTRALRSAMPRRCSGSSISRRRRP